MRESLTRNQAFNAMYQFLTGYQQQTGSEDIAALLGSCSLLPDGQTADPAMRRDWDVACDKAFAEDVEMHLNLEKGGISI